jgi:hypothetical protein
MSAYSIVNLKEEVEDSMGGRAPGIEGRFARKQPLSTPSSPSATRRTEPPFACGCDRLPAGRRSCCLGRHRHGMRPSASTGPIREMARLAGIFRFVVSGSASRLLPGNPAACAY